MYTKEDFLREHPPTEESLYLLPWEIEQLIENMKKDIEQGRLAKQRETILQILTHRFEFSEQLGVQISEQITKIKTEKDLDVISRCCIDVNSIDRLHG